MNIYAYKYPLKAVPGDSAEMAVNRYIDEIGLEASIAPAQEDFEIIVPHAVFVKLFRLARTLYQCDDYTDEDVEALVSAFCERLNYKISSLELWQGLLKWVERTLEFDDEDLNDWMN